MSSRFSSFYLLFLIFQYLNGYTHILSENLDIMFTFIIIFRCLKFLIVIHLNSYFFNWFTVIVLFNLFILYFKVNKCQNIFSFNIYSGLFGREHWNIKWTVYTFLKHFNNAFCEQFLSFLKNTKFTYCLYVAHKKLFHYLNMFILNKNFRKIQLL